MGPTLAAVVQKIWKFSVSKVAMSNSISHHFPLPIIYVMGLSLIPSYVELRSTYLSLFKCPMLLQHSALVITRPSFSQTSSPPQFSPTHRDIRTLMGLVVSLSVSARHRTSM